MSKRLKDKIWITSHVRIHAEKKYKLYNILSHIILSYLSFLLIIGMLFSEHFRTDPELFDKLMITLSLLVFASSLIVHGFKFGEKSNQFRECYLKLQALLGDFKSTEEPEKKYAEILAQYPNHSDGDYHFFLLMETVISGEEIEHGGKTKKFTWFMAISVIFRIVLQLVIIFAPPTVISYFFYSQFALRPYG